MCLSATSLSHFRASGFFFLGIFSFVVAVGYLFGMSIAELQAQAEAAINVMDRESDRASRKKHRRSRSPKHDRKRHRSHSKKHKHAKKDKHCEKDDAPAKKRHRTSRVHVPASSPPWAAPADLQAWEVPSPDYVQLDPTLCLILGAGAVTPEATAREITRLGGAPAFTTAVNRIADEHLKSGEPWISGACWGLSYITQKSVDPQSVDLWPVFNQTGGNMLKLLGSDICKVADFFASYPRANECASFWTGTDSSHILLIISAIARSLELAGDIITGKMLATVLDFPCTWPALINALRRISTCNHADPDRSHRLSTIANKLEGATNTNAFTQVQSVVATWPLRKHIPEVPVAAFPAQAPQHHGVANFVNNVHSALPPTVSSPSSSSVPPTHAPFMNPTQYIPHRGSRQGGSKAQLLCDATTFADLRELLPPENPSMLAKRFQDKAKTSTTPSATDTFLLDTAEHPDNRIKRWVFWAELAKAGLFVRQQYLGTDFSHFINCHAGPGSVGQYVVYTDLGTVLYMTTTKRLYSPNAKPELLRRLAAILGPWDVMQDSQDTFRASRAVIGPSLDAARVLAQFSQSA